MELTEILEMVRAWEKERIPEAARRPGHLYYDIVSAMKKALRGEAKKGRVKLTWNYERKSEEPGEASSPAYIRFDGQWGLEEVFLSNEGLEKALEEYDL